VSSCWLISPLFCSDGDSMRTSTTCRYVSSAPRDSRLPRGEASSWDEQGTGGGGPSRNRQHRAQVNLGLEEADEQKARYLRIKPGA